jgi:opacity protein-like surface antigen
MKKIVLAVIVVAIAITLAVHATGHADTAQVLPKGVYNADVIYYHYFDITERYDPDGNVEKISDVYNQNLRGSVFPDLRLLESAFATTPFAFPASGATLGRSVVDFTLMYRWWEFGFSYGLTDKLTIGVLIPYSYSKNEVKAKVDSSTANVIKNPCFNSTTPQCLAFAGGTGIPNTTTLIPKSIQDSGTLGLFGITGDFSITTEDVQNLLGGGLDIDGNGTGDAGGFGYQRVQTWSDSGIGDIELVAKYQFYNEGDWRISGGGGVRLPTGEVADPDSLVALPFGSGQTDLIFRLFADFTGIPDLLINTTLRYDLQLPDEQELRVPADVNLPLVDLTGKETVDRDLGDIIEAEVLGSYSITKEVSAGVKYRYTDKMKDKIDGIKGLMYSSLEDETDLTSHMIFLTLGYSTIQKYFDKEFPVPLTAGLTYRYRFAGTNNPTKSEYVSANLSVFFN